MKKIVAYLKENNATKQNPYDFRRLWVNCGVRSEEYDDWQLERMWLDEKGEPRCDLWYCGYGEKDENAYARLTLNDLKAICRWLGIEEKR